MCATKLVVTEICFLPPMLCVNEQLHILPTVQGSRAVSGIVGACLYYRAYSGVCLILHACHSLYYRAYSGVCLILHVCHSLYYRAYSGDVSY